MFSHRERYKQLIFSSYVKVLAIDRLFPDGKRSCYAALVSVMEVFLPGRVEWLRGATFTEIKRATVNNDT